MRNIWVAIVDDHDMFTQLMENSLNGERGFTVVFTANNGEKALEKLKNMDKLPDVILMDLEMPKMDGFTAIQRIKKKYPTVKIIAISMHQHDSYIVALMELGTEGYLPKNAPLFEVKKAILSVNEGESYYPNKAVTSVKDTLEKVSKVKKSLKNKRNPLTQRELEVLELVIEGKTYQKIAEALCISKRTVESHIVNIKTKTNKKTKNEVIAFAYENQIIPFKKAT